MSPKTVFPKVLFLTAVLSAAPLAFAQEDFRVEAFGGFAHQRGDQSHYFPQTSQERNGWVASQTVYIRPWLGIEAEISEMYGSYDQPAVHPERGGTAFGNLQDDRRTFLFGPRFRILSNERFTLGAHVLAGLAQGTREFGVLFPSQSGTNIPMLLTDTSNRFGGAIGGSLDVHLSERFSWRIQPDWMIRPRQGLDSSFRVSTGVVFRFGGRWN